MYTGILYMTLLLISSLLYRGCNCPANCSILSVGVSHPHTPTLYALVWVGGKCLFCSIPAKDLVSSSVHDDSAVKSIACPSGNTLLYRQHFAYLRTTFFCVENSTCIESLTPCPRCVQICLSRTVWKLILWTLDSPMGAIWTPTFGDLITRFTSYDFHWYMTACFATTQSREHLHALSISSVEANSSW